MGYLEATVLRVPDKPALTSQGQTLTFQALYDQARSVGSCLLSHGVTKVPVVVLMPKCPQTIAAFLGAIYAGCYYVPLDTEMPRQRMHMLLQTLDPGILICDETTQALAGQLEFQGPVVAYDRAAACPINHQALELIRRDQLDIDPIYVVFTSGSTGTPKGVVGCHRAVIDYIEALCQVLPFDESTVFGNQSPLYFDAWLKEVIPALKYGAVVNFIPKRLFLSPLRLVEYLNEHRINTLCWVVSALTMISSFRTFEKIRPEYLRTVAFASEVFPIRQLNIWRRALPDTQFWNLYGPTETTGICCYYRVDREFDGEEALPIGRPFPNTQVLLLDSQGQPASQGEICIRGTRLTLGYYRDPERTAASFTPNPLNTLCPETIYRTGDLGKWDQRGQLMFLGRKDHQIKHMGHRIELGEIEAAAMDLDGITAAGCVYARRKIHLYYTGTPAGELNAHLRQRLPRYMMPQVICCLEQMPRTPNGKINRNELQKRSKQHE